MREKIFKFNWLYGSVVMGISSIFLFGSQWIAMIFLPIPILLLLLFFFQHTKTRPSKFTRHISLGLLLSFIAMVLPIFDEMHFVFYIATMIVGLMAYASYSLGLQYSDSGYIPWYSTKNLSPNWAVFAVLFIGTLSSIVISRGVMGFEFPFVLYFLVLLIFMLQALKRKGTTSSISYQYILLATFLITISDMLNGITTLDIKSLTFKAATPLNFLIYFVAQYLITIGALYQDYKIPNEASPD